MKAPHAWRVLRYLRGSWKYLALSIAALTLGAVLTPLPPLLMREMIDRGFAGTSRFGLPALLLMFTLLPLLGTLLAAVRNWSMMRVGQRLLFALRDDLYQRLHCKSMAFFTARPNGEVLARMMSDSDAITGFPERMLSALSDLLTAACILIAAMSLNWRVSVLLLTLAPFLVLPLPLLGTAMYRSTKGIYERVEALTAYLHQSLSLQGILLAKILGTAGEETTRFRMRHRDAEAATTRGFQWKLGFDQLTNLVLMVPGTLLFWLAATRFGEALQLTPGTLLAFSAYLGSIYRPFTSAARLGAAIRSSDALFERIFEYMEAPEEPADPLDALAPNKVSGEVEFHHVTFQYEPGGRGVKDVSFTVGAGEVIALVGPSGSGKSTLALLLARIYRPESGQILLDGIDISQFSRQSLSRYVGVVTQEPYLFHGTIYENICYGTHNARQEEVEEAARAACILDFIRSLPLGFETTVGERGYRLSGGEKQRITIARLLLRNPRVLILDEATSALDTISEASIRSALATLMQGRTTLMITHRLSSLDSVPQIVVMQDGYIVERGSKERLLAAGGLFALMHRQQFPSDGAPAAD